MTASDSLTQAMNVLFETYIRLQSELESTFDSEAYDEMLKQSKLEVKEAHALAYKAKLKVESAVARMDKFLDEQL